MFHNRHAVAPRTNVVSEDHSYCCWLLNWAIFLHKNTKTLSYYMLKRFIMWRATKLDKPALHSCIVMVADVKPEKCCVGRYAHLSDSLLPQKEKPVVPRIHTLLWYIMLLLDQSIIGGQKDTEPSEGKTTTDSAPWTGRAVTELTTAGRACAFRAMGRWANGRFVHWDMLQSFGISE